MTPQRIAALALVLVALVWGVTFAMVQDAVEELPVLAFLAYRFLPAALLVGARLHLAARRCARVLRAVLRPAVHAAGPHRAVGDC